jgi:hypothetical protein
MLRHLGSEHFQRQGPGGKETFHDHGYLKRQKERRAELKREE